MHLRRKPYNSTDRDSSPPESFSSSGSLQANTCKLRRTGRRRSWGSLVVRLVEKITRLANIPSKTVKSREGDRFLQPVAIFDDGQHQYLQLLPVFDEPADNVRGVRDEEPVDLELQ